MPRHRRRPHLGAEHHRAAEMGIKHRRAEAAKHRDARDARTLLHLEHREQAAQRERDEHAVHPRPSRDDQRHRIEGPERGGNECGLDAEQLARQNEYCNAF